MTPGVPLNSDIARQTGGVLALLLAFYLAAPLYAIPVIGVSLSLPLVVILALRNGRLSVARRSPLSVFLFCLLLALVLSFLANVFTGDVSADGLASVKYILQFAFYAVAAGLGYKLFAREAFPTKATTAFAVGVLVMSIFILAENLVLGSLLSTGGWSRITRMSQNSYAVQFSSYLPFVYVAAIASKGRAKKSFWAIALVLCIAAVIINGSRSAWGTTALTFVIFFGFYSFASRNFRIALIVVFAAPLVLMLGWAAVPDGLRINLVKEFDTLDSLENDKSWMIRRLQIQKSMIIFQEHPWFGVGPAQFRNQSVALEMPELLASRDQYAFSDVSAHNSYIQFLAESGLFFMVPFVAMLGWLIVFGARASIVLAKTGELWPLALFAGLVGLSVHFWTISGLTTTGPWFAYGAMAAVIAKSKRVMQRSVHGSSFQVENSR